jgi:serine/threonine protein kinase
MVGSTVLHYQFLEKLGSGGMGDIYKALDTRLNRYVAIKVLTTAAAGDPERRRRFIQEAQAASALNHPNIITIHDIISEGNTEFMVMEYVTGKTLVDLIPKGGLRVPQVLKYSVQMADALQVAHASGIVHRDLKPANVMVTDSGLVKILDFGLAKLTDRGPLTTLSGPTDVTQTIAEGPLTVEGSIIGTVSYMSPEQAQGRKIDTRSDIFSFGVVLYEMVTGARAFEGDSALTTLSAILRDDTRPVAEFAPEAPPQMEMVIQRCLRKQPDDRWQTMGDVLMALSALKHESDSGTLYRARLSDTGAVSTATGSIKILKTERKAEPGPVLVGVVGGTIALIAALGGSIWWARHHKQPPPPVEQTVAPEAEPPAPALPEPPANPEPAIAAVNPDEPMTNEHIVQMVEAKVSDNQIIAQIRSSKATQFVITPAELIRLSKAGVHDSIIEVMRDPKKAAQASTPTPAHSTPKQSPQVQPAPAPAASAATPAPNPQPIPPTPQPSASTSTPASASASSIPSSTQAAQPTPVPPPSSAKAAPAVKGMTAVTLPDGTGFHVVLAGDIPADAKKGFVLTFKVSANVLVAGDMVAIAKGALLTGAVVDEKKKGVLGSGVGAKSMTFKLTQVEGADRNLIVRAEPTKGSDHPVDSSANGKVKSTDSIAAPTGTEYIAYIDGDQIVTVHK